MKKLDKAKTIRHKKLKKATISSSAPKSFEAFIDNFKTLETLQKWVIDNILELEQEQLVMNRHMASEYSDLVKYDLIARMVEQITEESANFHVTGGNYSAKVYTLKRFKPVGGK